MQGILTTSSPPLVTGIEIAKTDTSLLEILGSSKYSGLFLSS